MSIKDTDVRTPGDKEIAKKFKLSLAKVRQLVKVGADHEKEHNTNLTKAKQVARDHIGERPDYYKMLSKAEKTDKNHMKEEMGIGGVRGLGYVSGDPAGMSYVDQYINTNSMSYEDQNGNNLKYIKKLHHDLHNSKLGYKAFDPTKIGANKNFGNIAEQSLNELGDYDNKGGMAGYEAYSDYPPAIMRGRMQKPVDEGKKLEKAKKTAMAGLTAANLYTLGDVASRAGEGRGGTKGDIVRAASTLPGAAGWAATGVHYAKKAYDKVKQMKEEKNDLKGACWKGYTAKGLKKKGNRMVPNCVPTEQVSDPRYTERPTYEANNKYPDTAERGIYETIKFSLSHKVVHRDSKKIIAQGSKKEMMKKVKALNAKNPGSHFLGNSPSKKVGDTFSEGHIGFGKWGNFGDGFQYDRKNTYGKKPKEKPESNEPGTDDTYKGSKQGGKVKLVKKSTVKEAMVATAAQPVPASYQAAQQQQVKTIQPGQTKVNIRDIAPRSERSGTGTARLSQGGTSGGYNTLKPTTTDVKRNISNRFRTGFGQQGTSLGRQNVSGSSEFKPNSQSRSMNVGKAMGASKQTSSVVKGMSAAGQEASKKIVPKAASVAATAGRIARAVSGPEGAAVAAAAEPLAKKMASSYKAGHQSFTPHGAEGEKASSVFARMKTPSQGRSTAEYEKQTLTPKTYDKPAAPKVDAPTPPSRPDYFTRGQAFSAARKEAGGGEGKFSYQSGSDAAPKTYQTNVKNKPEPYKPESQLKQTSVKEARLNELKNETLGSYLGKASKSRKEALKDSKPDIKTWSKREHGIRTAIKKLTREEIDITHTIHEETTMDSKELINEALDNILDNNLNEMRDNLLTVLQEKAMEKLDERKKDIAANYFGQ